MDLLHLTEAASTQDLAKGLAMQGAPDRTLVWADRQTAGRGRLGRRWKSPDGGLYFSVILRPRFPPAALAEFSLAAAAAVAAALARETGITTAVKPPNDVMGLTKAGKPRKVAGILAEAAGDSRRVEWLVLGVGVNVNNSPPLASSASLRSLTGRTWKIPDILRRLVHEIPAR